MNRASWENSIKHNRSTSVGDRGDSAGGWEGLKAGPFINVGGGKEEGGGGLKRLVKNSREV